MRVTGIRSAGSVGVANYCSRLAEALAARGVDYVVAERPSATASSHFHLANSSRRCLGQILRATKPFVVTVHDVVPRDRRLMPVYRHVIWPLLARRDATFVVHSRFAAEMLNDESRVLPEQVRVIAHPVVVPTTDDRQSSRTALGWPTDTPIAVLPGVLKSAKLVSQAIAAAANGQARFQLALVGRGTQPDLIAQAKKAGVWVVSNPDQRTYEHAIVAADAVLVLRDGSVGETNGPLLDALGAGRAVLATPTGSIPEVANAAASYVAGDADSIRAGLVGLADDGARAMHEAHARTVARALSPDVIARAHADLFEEVFGV